MPSVGQTSDEPYCHGTVRADEVEPLVWQETERVLGNPAIIMAELARQEQQEATTQRDMTKEVQAIQKALDALEREAHQWDEAYAGEVIALDELKAKKL